MTGCVCIWRLIFLTMWYVYQIVIIFPLFSFAVEMRIGPFCINLVIHYTSWQNHCSWSDHSILMWELIWKRKQSSFRNYFILFLKQSQYLISGGFFNFQNLSWQLGIGGILKCDNWTWGTYLMEVTLWFYKSPSAAIWLDWKSMSLAMRIWWESRQW